MEIREMTMTAPVALRDPDSATSIFAASMAAQELHSLLMTTDAQDEPTSVAAPEVVPPAKRVISADTRALFEDQAL